MKILPEEIAVFCRDLFAEDVIELEFPAGKDRKTVLVHLQGQSIIVSKRSSTSRAKLEASVLRKLSVAGQVPSLVGHRGDMLAQEILQGNRLSAELELRSTVDREKLLVLAGHSLLDLQEAGRHAGLMEYAPAIGQREGWFLDYAKSPLHLAKIIGATSPEYDVKFMAEKISVQNRAFIKWDARPGNALVTSSNLVSWFDWEHCGNGSVEDDLVWLLADEWTPINERAEETLLRRAALECSISFDELSDRFRKKAVLHSAVRLALIFKRKGSGPWWNVKESMEMDRVGVSLPHVRRVCTRAKRWAGGRGYGNLNLVNFFEAVEQHAQGL